MTRGKWINDITGLSKLLDGVYQMGDSTINQFDYWTSRDDVGLAQEACRSIHEI